MENPANPQHGNASPVVRCAAYDGQGSCLGDIAIEDISETLARRDVFVWVGLYEPEADVLETLQEEFGLHDLAIEDARHAHQRTKLDAYGNSLFLAVKTARLENGSIVFGETHIFLGKRFLITVRHGTLASYAPVRRLCEARPELLRLGPSYALYAVLDFIVDNYLPLISDFQDELRELEHDVFSDHHDRETIRKLYDMQRDLLTLRLATGPLQDVTNQLIRLYPELIHDGTRAYFRDVNDHLSRVNEAVMAMREMLAAALNVNLSLTTFGQNEVVKKLASWAAMLAAPTLITSWYGMNFHHMPELDEPWAYVAMMILTAGLVGVLYYALRRAGWL